MVQFQGQKYEKRVVIQIQHLQLHEGRQHLQQRNEAFGLLGQESTK